jgi:hypothetical protein
MRIELYAHLYYSQNIDYSKEDAIVGICSTHEGSNKRGGGNFIGKAAEKRTTSESHT